MKLAKMFQFWKQSRPACISKALPSCFLIGISTDCSHKSAFIFFFSSFCKTLMPPSGCITLNDVGKTSIHRHTDGIILTSCAYVFHGLTHFHAPTSSSLFTFSYMPPFFHALIFYHVPTFLHVLTSFHVLTFIWLLPSSCAYLLWCNYLFLVPTFFHLLNFFHVPTFFYMHTFFHLM